MSWIVPPVAVKLHGSVRYWRRLRSRWKRIKTRWYSIMMIWNDKNTLFFFMDFRVEQNKLNIHLRDEHHSEALIKWPPNGFNMFRLWGSNTISESCSHSQNIVHLDERCPPREPSGIQITILAFCEKSLNLENTVFFALSTHVQYYVGFISVFAQSFGGQFAWSLLF